MGYVCEAGFRQRQAPLFCSVNEVYQHSMPPPRENAPAVQRTARVLIAGAGSYIGTNVKYYLQKYDDYTADVLDTRNLRPQPQMFRNYDTVIFVAGIAHRKETKKNAHLYYEINRNLAVRTAEAARAAHVQYFVLLSSMAVYGMETGHITKDTRPDPKNHYGKSKLQADAMVWNLRNEQFRTAILRPPMVYGKGCRGNYRLFRLLVLLVPVFPSVENRRSMVYIGNLCAFIKDLIDEKREGIFFPQNGQYVNTGELAMQIADAHKKTIKRTGVFNPVLKRMPFKSARKMFGSLTYEGEDAVYAYGFADSVRRTESGNKSARHPGTVHTDCPLPAGGLQIKRVLAAGMDLYIAEAFRCYMLRWPSECRTDVLSTEEESWKESDFADCDAVLYTGIAGCRKKGRKQQDLWREDVRRAVRAANMAKHAGARMFVYLSSLHVYGTQTETITEMTPVCPSDAYGKAQLKIEKELWKMKDAAFRVAILRLPMVYGFECGGRYQEIQKLVSRNTVFPEYGRKYSVIHIDNLSSAVRRIMHYGSSGIYFPQDAEYASAYDMAAGIAEFHGKRLHSTKLLNPVIRLAAARLHVASQMPSLLRLQTLEDIFCGYVCSRKLNVPQEWLEVRSLKEGIRLAESGW